MVALRESNIRRKGSIPREKEMDSCWLIYKNFNSCGNSYLFDREVFLGNAWPHAKPAIKNGSQDVEYNLPQASASLQRFFVAFSPKSQNKDLK